MLTYYCSWAMKMLCIMDEEVLRGKQSDLQPLGLLRTALAGALNSPITCLPRACSC